MDALIFILVVLLIVAFVCTAIERLPLPAKPSWLKGVIEGGVCLIGAFLLATHFGILPG